MLVMFVFNFITFVFLFNVNAENITDTNTENDQADNMFLVLPPSNWKTAIEFCSLLLSHDLNNLTLMKANQLIQTSGYSSSWTKTRVNYSRWTVFIGCADHFEATSQFSSVTVKECVGYCSDMSALYLAFKNGLCYCVNLKPAVNKIENTCRKKCLNTSEFVCHGGPSALILEYLESVPKLIDQRRYIKDECVAWKPQAMTHTIHECTENIYFGCNPINYDVNPKSWYFYQDECLERENFVLHGMNTTYAGARDPRTQLWTPIFRAKTIITDANVDTCNEAITIRKDGLYVHHCTEKLPFICMSRVKKDDLNITDEALMKFSLIGLGLVLACCLVVIAILGRKYWRLITTQKRCKTVDQLNMKSNENTLELEDNIKHVDQQGYLIPEAYYSSISNVPADEDTPKGQSKVSSGADSSEDKPKISRLFSNVKKKFQRNRKNKPLTPVVGYSPVRVGIEDYQGYMTSDHYYKSITDRGGGHGQNILEGESKPGTTADQVMLGEKRHVHDTVDRYNAPATSDGKKAQEMEKFGDTQSTINDDDVHGTLIYSVAVASTGSEESSASANLITSLSEDQKPESSGSPVLVSSIRGGPIMESGRSSPLMESGRSSPLMESGRSSPTTASGKSSPLMASGRNSPKNEKCKKFPENENERPQN